MINLRYEGAAMARMAKTLREQNQQYWAQAREIVAASPGMLLTELARKMSDEHPTRWSSAHRAASSIRQSLYSGTLGLRGSFDNHKHLRLWPLGFNVPGDK